MSEGFSNVSVGTSRSETHAVGTHYSSDIQVYSARQSMQSGLLVIQKFESELNDQYQRDQQALNKLNERLRVFIDRIQQLESQNAVYLAQLATLVRQSVDIESTEDYTLIQTDLTSVNYRIIDYELEFEVFQMEIVIYQELINIEQQWRHERRSKLELELNQSVSVLAGLRTSYGEFEQEVQSLHVTCNQTYQKYMLITQEWSRVKKSTRQWQLSLQILKNQILFYKKLRTYISRETETLSTVSTNVMQFRTYELDKLVKRIRHDFEQLYATIYHQMTVYYEMKMEEVAVEVKQMASYQQVEVEKYQKVHVELQAEYEEVQQMYSYEAEWEKKLKATYAQLEIELKSIQTEQNERIDAQIQQLSTIQESVVIMTSNIEETRRKKIILEAEIIIYRDILDCTEIQEHVIIAPSVPLRDSTTRVVMVIENHKKESVGIGECPIDGTYISLVNHSATKEINISRWSLTRYVELQAETQYTFPERTRLPPNGEIRIYTKASADAAKAWINQVTGSLATRQQIINNDITSWGTGNVAKILLFNELSEEMATYMQTTDYEKRNIK